MAVELDVALVDDDAAVFTFDADGRREPVEHWSDLLWQSTWWQDADGGRTLWRLDELSSQQCALIHHFVAREEEATGTRLVWGLGGFPEPNAFQASVDLGRADLELTELVSRRGWILRTPLMAALHRRIQNLPAVTGTCFCSYPVAEGWDHGACHAGMEIA
ncbi:hypothetical protein AB0D73_28960 [Streptomyces sp. NPDC048215]|uniref:hypothetical protein n=1 Tax=Streptomyces sp. NPDC048215 TaxID=3156690 RepID=UPI0033C6A287